MHYEVDRQVLMRRRHAYGYKPPFCTRNYSSIASDSISDTFGNGRALDRRYSTTHESGLSKQITSMPAPIQD